jgi:halocyanin-like protein
MSEERDARLGRRRLLQAGAGAVGAGLVGAGAAGTAAAQSGAFDGWMGDVGNYEGIVDMTGQSEVTVTVGAEGNGGNYAFDPAAAKIDPGTTVVWEWTGEGQQHNVVAEEGGDFESELTADAGFTFERTVDAEGVVKYFCTPHRALGMKGVLVVGDVDTGAEVVSPGGGGGGGGGGDGVSGSGGSDAGGTSGGNGGGGGGASLGRGSLLMSLIVGGSLVAAFLSPFVFGLLLLFRNRGRDGGEPEELGVEHG